MKRVLIITYYWPPSGGAGVQRWLKFSKYLREFGWDPVIYTPENPESPAEDPSLLNDVPEGLEVIKTPIWEPYAVYKTFTGRKKSDRIKTGFLSEKKKPSLPEKISVWIRGNLFIPDARKFWISPSVKFLLSYLEGNPVDAIVSTGPPHSMHLIALGLKKKLNLPWIADFRDPWTNIDFYSELKLTKRSDRKHQRLENLVLKTANRVIVIGQGMADDFNRIHNREYDVITNGFDETSSLIDYSDGDGSFSIAHVGSMVPSRNPISLWNTLKELCDEYPDLRKSLKINLIGHVDHSVKSSIETYQLTDFLSITDYLPHSEMIRVQRESSILLLLINNTPNARLVVTGKVFEYIRSGRPVLCLGPTDGDAASILAETNTGQTIDPEDSEGLKKALINYFTLFKANRLQVLGHGTDRYSRRNLTNKLANLLDSL